MRFSNQSVAQRTLCARGVNRILLETTTNKSMDKMPWGAYLSQTQRRDPPNKMHELGVGVGACQASIHMLHCLDLVEQVCLFIPTHVTHPPRVVQTSY